MAAVVLVGGDGVRFRERTRGGRKRERMRGRGEKRCGACVALRGIVQSDEGGDRQEGRKEVARRGGPRGTQLLGEGGKTTEEDAAGPPAGWASLLGRWAAQELGAR